jgi:DNA polymerase-3 subunit epsilon
VYINPEREIDEGATQVHGMTWDELKDKPRFADVADAFLSFVEGAQIVIHNAEFDRGFLDDELKRIGRPPFATHVARIIDSLSHARDLHPGQRNSLDALCQRYAISNEHRVLHGALLDARLLADVYMAMTRGQESLVMLHDDHLAEGETAAPIDVSQLVVRRASDAERQAHQAILADIDKASGGKTVWQREA